MSASDWIARADVGAALEARDRRQCVCGHASISHASHLTAGRPCHTGEGLCGLCPCRALSLAPTC